MTRMLFPQTLRWTAMGILAITGAVFSESKLIAQQRPPARVTEADRTRVLETLGRGDLSAADKIMSELQAQFQAAPPASSAASGSVAFEELKACGFYPQETRLECVIEIKRSGGYNGLVGAFGSVEHVYFCVDWDNNNVFTQLESAGQGSVQMHDDNPNARPPWQYAVYRDFNPFGGFRTLNSGGTAPTVSAAPTLKVKAILSWFAAPNGCNFQPVWGNILQFQIRMDPIR